MKFETHTVNWDNGKSKYEWFCESCQKFHYDEDREQLHNRARQHHKDCMEKIRIMKEENPEGYKTLAHYKGWGENEADNVSDL